MSLWTALQPPRVELGCAVTRAKSVTFEQCSSVTSVEYIPTSMQVQKLPDRILWQRSGSGRPGVKQLREEPAPPDLTWQYNSSHTWRNMREKAGSMEHNRWHSSDRTKDWTEIQTTTNEEMKHRWSETEEHRWGTGESGRFFIHTLVFASTIWLKEWKRLLVICFYTCTHSKPTHTFVVQTSPVLTKLSSVASSQE